MPYPFSYFAKTVVVFHLTTCTLLGLAQGNDTQPAPTHAPILQFDVTAYEITGNTLLTQLEINTLLAPYTGKNKNFTVIQQAVKVLEQAYYKKGYNIVRVMLPEQELNQGTVQIKVIETRIGKITVKNNHFFNSENIRNSLPLLQENTLPNTADISRSLKIANENPNKKAVIQFDTDTPGNGVDTNIQVTDKRPWIAALSLDNTGEPQTGHNRVTATYQHSNIGNLDHILSMQYTTSAAHTNRVTILGAGYHIPLYKLGDSLDFYGSYSNADAGIVNVSGFGFNVSGNGVILGTRYNHSFNKVSSYDSTLSLGLDRKQFTDNISIFDIPLGNKIIVHPISLTYSGNWVIPSHALNFSISALHNIAGGHLGGSTQFDVSRAHANPSYNMLRMNANYVHAFKSDWQVRVALNAQATPDALIPGEQYGLGGAASVRGFGEREAIDDQGVGTNLELYTPNICPLSMVQCRILGFYDGGYLFHNKGLPGEINKTSLSSVGLGLRINISTHWILQADYAYVTNGTDITKTGDKKLHFKVVGLM